MQIKGLTGMLMLVLLIILPGVLRGSTPDSSRIEWRSFDEAALQQLRDSDRYLYDRRPPAVLSLWDRFLLWLASLLGKVFLNPAYSTPRRIGFILVSLAILIYAIYKLTDGQMSSLWDRRRAALNLAPEDDIEDIQQLDLEPLVAAALASGDYRRATRLFYLKALRALADRSIIDWRRDRTNGDYLLDLSGHPLQQPFRRITTIFDYIYYGNFVVDAGRFQQVRQHFDAFYTELEHAE